VSVEYYDLFSPEMGRFPEVLALVKAGDGAVPLVFVGDELLSAGGKVSVPAIRRRLEALGMGNRKAKQETGHGPHSNTNTFQISDVQTSEVSEAPLAGQVQAHLRPILPPSVWVGDLRGLI